MKKTHKGFTLVELLIVIVVIGILSAMMMLSSTEAVSSAKASTITSNLRNLKTATLALYTDDMATYDADPQKVPTIKEVCQYLNGKDKIPDKDDYYVVYGEYNTESGEKEKTNGWFVVYKAASLPGDEGARIRDKLKSRAKSLGLVKKDAYTTAYDGSKVDVALQVR